MATTPTNPITETEVAAGLPESRVPSWPRRAASPREGAEYPNDFQPSDFSEEPKSSPSGRDALQALLAFSALHQQVRYRTALAAQHQGFETMARPSEFEPGEQFVLNEVLQLVAERAIAITGADGLGIALAENDEIVLRASAGAIKPDVGARIERDSAFSGACLRTAQIIRCDDTETDDRVNLSACRKLGARSMVAVPLCGRKRVIGLLEAFSAEPFGFNDSDTDSLELLAELILGALKPEDEERFAEAAQAAVAGLVGPPIPSPAAPAPVPPAPAPPAPEPPAPEPPAMEQLLAEPVTSAETAPPAVVRALPAAVVEPAVVEPATALAAPDLMTTPAEVLEETPAEETISEAPAPLRPGMIPVLVLVVVSALLAGGLWWKLKNAQLGQALVPPTQTTAMTHRAAAKQPAPASTTPSSTLPASVVADAQNGSTSIFGATDGTGAAEAGSGPATPQEVSKLSRITGIRHWSSADSSTVVIDLQDQVQYEAHRLPAPDRIYFDLHDTSLVPELEGKTIEIGDPLLSRVRIAQPIAGLTRVVLETKANSTFSVSLEPDPYRLLVQVRKTGANSAGQVNLFPGAQNQRDQRAIVVPPPTREDLQFRAKVPKMRIVVDAGHGGWDLGTVGRRGLLEKDLVLEIAQRLGKLLESRLGAEVILTRNDDNYIPLDERAAMANQAQADLFVSVHANYSDLPSARGVETYYTNFFSAPNARDSETRESATASKKGSTVALTSVDLHERIEQSRRLAASVQRSLYGTLSAENPGLRDRGVKQASYVVLTETAMPGILAEVSFVSSPTDEQRLRNDGYREQIAEALYRGIAHYAAAPRGLKVAGAGK
jgi:N-acetylmuramoyl-L-alanine amidase/putative methionine-R-sulfoxide reductase with GAF domain